MDNSTHDENPLERSLKQELEASEWLQKFKQLSQLLTTIKAEIPLTQLCQLEWLTDSNTLRIRCPNQEVWQGLIAQQEQLIQKVTPVGNITLEYQEQCKPLG